MAWVHIIELQSEGKCLAFSRSCWAISPTCPWRAQIPALCLQRHGRITPLITSLKTWMGYGCVSTWVPWAMGTLFPLVSHWTTSPLQGVLTAKLVSKYIIIMTFHCLVALKEAGYLAEPMKVFPASAGGMVGCFVSQRLTRSGLYTVLVRYLLCNKQSSSGYKDINL